MPYRRNVFILGAGFSGPARAPLMRNFIEKARQLRRNPDDPLPREQAETFDRAFAYIDQLFHAQARVSLDVENIEAAFGLAEMDLAFGVDARADVRYALEALILQTLERSINPDAQELKARISGSFGNGWRSFHTHYGKVFAALASRRWFETYGASETGTDAVITFNYDCFLDDSLMDLGVVPQYALPVEYPHRWHSSHGLELLKLHGSTNWLRCKSEKCAGRIWVVDGGSAERRNYQRGMTCSQCTQATVEPLIVPPTWAKGEYRDPLTTIWRRALEVLSNAERLFIIGYSLPEGDTFFKYLLGLALRTNNDLSRIIVVNRNVEAREKLKRFFQEPYRSHHLIDDHDLQDTVKFTQHGMLKALNRVSESLNAALIEESGLRLQPTAFPVWLVEGQRYHHDVLD